MNWAQFKTLLWLRTRLTRRQWSKSGGVGAVIAAIVGVMMLMMSAGSFVAALLVGRLALGDARPMVIAAIWLGLTVVFCFIWMIALITELQRSETIDVQRLMHLPVHLGQIFGINYVVSHLTLSVILVVPAMMGMSIGLALSRGPAMLLMAPLALSMVFTISAWTYYLRGWLATLMSNPRKRRTVIMALTASIILIAQAPNIYFNVLSRRDRPKSGQKLTAEERERNTAQYQADVARMMRVAVVIPPAWVPLGAKALAEGRSWPALAGILGAFAIGALGLQRAYRSTVRFYQGESGGKASAKRPAAKRRPGLRPRRTPLLERQIPRVPEQVAAVALATLQSALRAPEMKMQMGVSFLVPLVVGGSLLFREAAQISPTVASFIVTGVGMFSIFMLVSLLANQFGFDREGFRAYVLSPADRRLILIGKNLGALPFASLSAATLVIVVSIFLHLSPLVTLATLAQVAAGLCLAAMAGNLLSILLPFRIQPGSMKPSKMPALSMLMLVVTQMCLPLALAPSLVPPLAGYLFARAGWLPASVVNLAFSLVLATAVIAIYKATLAPMGRLLHSRETKILATLSAEVE